MGWLTGQRRGNTGWREFGQAAAPHWAALALTAVGLVALSSCAVWSAIVSCRRHQSKRYEVVLMDCVQSIS